MAHFIQAVRRFGPRIIPKEPVSQEQLHERLALATGLRRSQVAHMLIELSDAIAAYASIGASVHLAGIGRFYNASDIQGRLRLHYSPDSELRKALPGLDKFRGDVANRENVGISPAGLKALWDAEFPEDPLELPVLLSEEAA
jgi:hypothetical protein